MLAIFGICIKIQKLSTGKRSVYMHISGWHTFDLWNVRCLIVTGWNRWRFGWMWHRFWCRLSVSLGWRCTRSFASSASLGVLCYAIVAMKEAVHVIFPKHSQVSSHPSLHIIMPMKPNSALLLFLDFRPRFHDNELCFLHCVVRNPSFGHFGHIQGRVHVRLF